MIFDTDIIMWIQRGNKKAGNLVDSDDDRSISIIIYMESLQNANKQATTNNHKELFKRDEFYNPTII